MAKFVAVANSSFVREPKEAINTKVPLCMAKCTFKKKKIMESFEIWIGDALRIDYTMTKLLEML